MKPIRAFVGHSFRDTDKIIVRTFLDFLGSLKKSQIDFDWQHAEEAEPNGVSKKVLRLFEGKNLFIGVCTANEYAISNETLSNSHLGLRFAKTDRFQAKTSDWINQEIGLAVGLGLKVIVLLEKGVRSPSGLLGDTEYIQFERQSPERCLQQLFEMISKVGREDDSAQASIPETISLPNVEAAEEDSLPIFEHSLIKPQPTWEEHDYHLALLIATKEQDNAALQLIDQSYLASRFNAGSQAATAWEARKEYSRLMWGQNGRFRQLKDYADANPNNSAIAEMLARVYHKYEKFDKSAKHYAAAAHASDNKIDKLHWLGLAAIAFNRARQTEEANKLLSLIRAEAGNDTDNLKTILMTEREIATQNNNDDLIAASLEALLELDPADHDTRFNLAYKYSSLGHDDLALYHYLKIPSHERSEATWNNLGVAYARLHMPIKAVDCYKLSESQRGTVAMSNMAKKLLDAGFLSDAEALCEKALAIPAHSPNIEETIGKLKASGPDEVEKENKALEKIRSASEFMRDFGNAIVTVNTSNISPYWQGPDCVLKAEIVGRKFIAIGEYERSPGLGLGASLFGALSNAKYKIEYQGEIHGSAVVGIVNRTEVGAVPRASLLGYNSEPPHFLLIIEPHEQRLRVMERSNSGAIRLYDAGQSIGA